MNFFFILFHPLKSLRMLREAVSLQEKVEESRRECDVLRKESEEMRSQVRVAEIGRIDCEHRLDIGDKENSKLKQEIARLRRKLKEEEEIEREMVRIEERIEKAEQFKRTYESKIRKLEEELEKFKRELREERVRHAETRRLLSGSQPEIKTSTPGDKSVKTPKSKRMKSSTEERQWYRSLPDTI